MSSTDQAPPLLILADIATEMIERQKHGLDDLLVKELERLNSRIRKLQSMVEQGVSLVESLADPTALIDIDAREDLDAIEDFMDELENV